jgi:hypothetical protein
MRATYRIKPIFLHLIILILATVNVISVTYVRLWPCMLQFSRMGRRALGMEEYVPAKHHETSKHDVVYQKIVFLSST